VPSWFKQLIGETPPLPLKERYVDALSARQFQIALPLLHQACKEEDEEAMTLLGHLYAVGEGVARDPEESMLWFRQAAVRGHPHAQALLAYCYGRGEVLKKNEEESAYWTFRAADGGHPVAREWLLELWFSRPYLIGKSFTLEDITRVAGKTPNYERFGGFASPAGGLFGDI